MPGVRWKKILGLNTPGQRTSGLIVGSDNSCQTQSLGLVGAKPSYQTQLLSGPSDVLSLTRLFEACFVAGADQPSIIKGSEKLYKRVFFDHDIFFGIYIYIITNKTLVH